MIALFVVGFFWLVVSLAAGISKHYDYSLAFMVIAHIYAVGGVVVLIVGDK